MTPPQRPSAAVALGFALGVGLCAVALVGTVLHLAYPDRHWLLLHGPSFAVGALMGAGWAAIRGVPRLS